MRDPLSLRAADPTVRTARTTTAAGRIDRIRALTHDMREVVIRRSPDSPPLRPAAGQFVVLEADGLAQPRPFSLARAPEEERPGEHTLLVRLVPGGLFSDWLSAADRVGTPVRITGPLGAFVLDPSSAPMICIAGGSGLSAIHAIVEHACNLEVARDCYLFYGARAQRDLCLTRELAAIGRRWHPAFRFECVQVLSEEPPESDWQGPRGLVTDVVADAWLARGRLDVPRSRAYLCGPPPMVAAARRLLTEAGMPPGAIFRDVFDDVRSPAPVIDNTKCVLCDECLLVKPLADCIVEASELHYDADGALTGFTRLAPARSSSLYYNSLVIDPAVCIRCHACVNACPHGAISTTHSRHVVSLRQGGGGAPSR
jgi:NAD(P)H-flavin reductase